MKVKKIDIGIKGLGESLKDFAEYLEIAGGGSEGQETRRIVF